MNFTTRKSLISILCAFLVCLIASTATTVVCAEESNVEEEPYWGNLKAGDEMRWKYRFSSVYSADVYYELEIFELQGESLKVHQYEHLISLYVSPKTGTTKRGTATLTSDELWPFIYPAALIQENKDVIVKTYEYEGSTYIAAYYDYWVSDGKHKNHYEYWWDYYTGILFEWTRTVRESGVVERRELKYTNADLTTPEMVPGYQLLLLQGFPNSLLNFLLSIPPLMIALVAVPALLSVGTHILYMIARYQKKKKKNT